MNKKNEFSDEKHKNSNLNNINNNISNNQNNQNNQNSTLTSKQNQNSFEINKNTFYTKSPDKACAYGQNQSSGPYGGAANQASNLSNSTSYYNSASNYYNSTNNTNNNNSINTNNTNNNNNNNINSTKHNMPGNLGINNSNAYNKNTGSNYTNYSQSGQNHGNTQENNLNRHFSNSNVSNQSQINNSSNYTKNCNSQNPNYYPNQASQNANTNQNQGWFSNKYQQHNFNNTSTSTNNHNNNFNSNNNNSNNYNYNINNNLNTLNENFHSDNYNQDNAIAPLSEENELKQMNAKYTYHSDCAKLASEFLKLTHDESFYSKLRAKLDIKENLLADKEADLLKVEEIEKINEKKLYEKFVAEKIKECLIANNKGKAIEDFFVEIPIENNNTNNTSISTKTNSTNNKNNKMIEENKIYDFSERMDLEVSSSEAAAAQNKHRSNDSPRLFHERISFEEFERFFLQETNIELNRYLESSLYYFYTTQSKEALNKPKSETALEPSFLLSFIAANSKNRKLEKFLKESFSAEKLESEKNKFISFVAECEKADFSEYEKLKKSKIITDEEPTQLSNSLSIEISEEMLKFSNANLPFYYVQEEIPKEIKEVEMSAKKIKSEIYNCENSSTKIFVDRLEIKRKIQKLVAKVSNAQEIKKNLRKYKA